MQNIPAQVDSGEYKTWTGSMDQVHQNMDRLHGPPIFTTEVNNNKIKRK